MEKERKKEGLVADQSIDRLAAHLSRRSKDSCEGDKRLIGSMNMCSIIEM